LCFRVIINLVREEETVKKNSKGSKKRNNARLERPKKKRAGGGKKATDRNSGAFLRHKNEGMRKRAAGTKKGETHGRPKKRG